MHSMAGLKAMAVLGLVFWAVSLGGKWAARAQQVHHVVGGDRGWDPSTGIASWSSGRVFKVGDQIWFAYSAAQGSVAEVRSREEYEACDVSNPIRMYTDGLDNISLDSEGMRFFASSNSDHCKNGLKLHIEVQPRDSPPVGGILQVTATSDSEKPELADGPTSPSGSGRLSASFVLVAFALLGFVMSY